MKNRKNKVEPMLNILVPEHTILTPDEERKVLNTLKVDKEKIPKIYIDDPALSYIKDEEEYPSGFINRLVKIKRKSRTAGISIFYRVIVDRVK